MSILRCLAKYKLICVFEGDFHHRVFRVRSQNIDKTGFLYNGRTQKIQLPLSTNERHTKKCKSAGTFLLEALQFIMLFRFIS